MKTWEAVGLGLLVSMRSMTLPAVMSNYLSAGEPEAPDGSDDPLPQWLRYLAAQPEIAQLTRLAAFGEIVFDKLPFIPSRTALLPITGRMAVAGLLAAALSERAERTNVVTTAALAAALGSVLAYTWRKRAVQRTHLPDPLVALIEDALVVSGSLNWRDTYAARAALLESSR